MADASPDFPWGLILFGLFSIPLIKSMIANAKLNSAPAIGRLYLHGTIQPGIAENGLNPRAIEQQLKRVKDQKNIKGLLVDINSPGGAAVASGDIAEMISKVKIPKVALVRDICASGGYMVASACDEIVASESSIVGSIGVISQQFVVEDLMEKVGVKHYSFKAGKSKDALSPFHEPTEEGKMMLQEILDTSYEDFLKKVAKYRELPLEDVKSCAEGYIYSGKKAQELGLVDKIGGLEEAISLLEEKGNFKHKHIVELKKKTGLLQTLLGSYGRDIGQSVGEGMTDAIVQKLRSQYPSLR